MWRTGVPFVWFYIWLLAFPKLETSMLNKLHFDLLGVSPERQSQAESSICWYVGLRMAWGSVVCRWARGVFSLESVWFDSFVSTLQGFAGFLPKVFAWPFFQGWFQAMTTVSAQVWFNLGCGQQTRGGLDAAERSFGRAFRSCPATTTATDAALRQDGVGKRFLCTWTDLKDVAVFILKAKSILDIIRHEFPGQSALKKNRKHVKVESGWVP